MGVVGGPQLWLPLVSCCVESVLVPGKLMQQRDKLPRQEVSFVPLFLLLSFVSRKEAQKTQGNAFVLLWLEPTFEGKVVLTQQVHSRQIDDLVAAAAENCFRHEQAETFCLFQSNRRRHGEFLTRYKNLDQCRAVMFESSCNHWFYLLRSLRS